MQNFLQRFFSRLFSGADPEALADHVHAILVVVKMSLVVGFFDVVTQVYTILQKATSFEDILAQLSLFEVVKIVLLAAIPLWLAARTSNSAPSK